jgi:hypothetical protein
MSRAYLIAFVAGLLSTVVGCGATATRHSATPSAAVAQRDDASWSSPEERELAVVETGSPPASTRGDVTSISFRPNKNDRPTSGAVHAATY